MKMIICLSVFLLALFVGNAQGQYIEIRYEVTATDHGWTRIGRSVLIFDTSVAPELGGAGGEQIYYAIAGQYYVDSSSRINTPFKVLDEDVDVFDRARLIYSPNNQEVGIQTFQKSGRWLEIRISHISAEFFESMESLPDAPESYAMMDDSEFQYLEGRIPNANTSWNSKDGFSNGAVTYGARLVTELEPEACSPADLNQDGIVDFFDISIFIQLFMQGCP